MTYTPFTATTPVTAVELNKRLTELDEGIAAVGGMPVGCVLPYGTATPPSGWLICDGSAVSRSIYAALFAVIGTAFGSGDGSTTFNLPDLRGRVPTGVGTGTGLTTRAMGDQVGVETHILTANQLPTHSHTEPQVPSSANASSGAGFIDLAQGNIATTSTGGGGAHNNMQPTLVFNYLIKA